MNTRFAAIDGLRFLSALNVMLFHMTYMTPWKAFATIFSMGHLSVSMFIVISGYCLMLPAIRRQNEMPQPFLQFMVRRGIRLLPPLYAVAVLYAILHFTVMPYLQPKMNWTSLYSTLLMLHHFYPEHAIPEVTGWSLGVEWNIYFLFPLLLFAWRRIGPYLMMGIVGLLGYVIVIPIYQTMSCLTAHYVLLFALGMFACAVVNSPQPAFARLRAFKYWSAVAIAVLGGLAAVFMTLFASGYSLLVLQRYYPWWDLACGLGSCALLIAATSSGRLNALFSHRIISKPGEFSYSLYLLHPLALLTAGLITASFVCPLWAHYALSIIIALALSYAFFRLVEGPFARLSKNIFQGARSRESGVRIQEAKPGIKIPV